MIKFDMLTSNKECIEKEILEFEKKKNNLPDELDYIEIDDGIAIAQPNKEIRFKLVSKIDNNLLKKVGGDVTKIDEYMYNSQKPFPVETVFVGESLIPKDKMIIAPFKNLEFKALFIVPNKFSKNDYWEAYVCIGKKKFKVKFIRSAYDGIGVKRYIGDVNSDFTITLEFFENNNFQCKIKFNMKEVNKITDILKIGEYLNNIHTLKINDFKLGLKVDKFDNNLFLIVDFWNKVRKLGNILKKRFSYKKEILQREVDDINDLYKSIVEDKFCINKNQVKYLSFKSEINGIDKLPINKNMCIVGVGETDIEILGKVVRVFTEFIFINYEFKGVTDDIDENVEITIKIESTDNSLILEKYFINEQDRDKLHEKITSGEVDLNKLISSFVEQSK